LPEQMNLPATVLLQIGRLLVVISGLLFHLWQPAYCQEQNALLEGKIEHSLCLPPLNPELQPGRRYDERNMHPLKPALASNWWRVPPWLVGSWHNVGRVTQLSFSNLETKESYQTRVTGINYPEHEVIGLQKDRQGDVWTCVPTPYLSRDHVGQTMNVNLIDLADAVETNDNEVLLRLRATTLVIDSPSQIIKAVSQRESLQTYRPVSHGKILVLASMRFYDANGQPKFARELLTHCRRAADFQELEFWTSPGTALSIIDLRESFDTFLKEQNLAHLLPERKKLARN
jgi:hypothetical protein